jgi:hypothetical protein
MNYQAFTNDSLTMMYEAIRGALAADDALKRQGLATRFRVPPWTPEEDERLRKLALTRTSVAAMAKQMHRSMAAVRNRAARLRIVVAKSHNQEARAEGEGKMKQVGARHDIIREWRSLPKEQRQTDEQAEAFAMQIKDKYKFSSDSADPYRQMGNDRRREKRRSRPLSG